MVRLARQEVAAARAAVDQQTAAGRVAALDLRAVVRAGARDQSSGLLLDPAERGDVLVRAEEDACLRRAGLRRKVGLPLDEPVRPLVEPAGHRRRAAVAHRKLEDRQPEPVDLEEDDSRRVGLDAVVAALRDPRDHLQRVRVVVLRAEEDAERDARRRGDDRDEKRRPERIDRELAVREAVGEQQDPRVEEQDREKADEQGQREPERGDDRRQDRVQDPDHHRCKERGAEAVHVRARDDRAADQQRQRRDQPRDEELDDAQARTRRAPDARVAVACRGHRGSLSRARA